jgi:hypothetical protein
MATDTIIEKGNPITGSLADKVRFCRKFDRPIMVFGPPGAGKSQQIHQAKDEDDLVIDCRLTSLESIDMRGLPIIKKDVHTKNPEAVVWVRPEFLPGDEGVVVDRGAGSRPPVGVGSSCRPPPSWEGLVHRRGGESCGGRLPCESDECGPLGPIRHLRLHSEPQDLDGVGHAERCA